MDQPFPGLLIYLSTSGYLRNLPTPHACRALGSPVG